MYCLVDGEEADSDENAHVMETLVVRRCPWMLCPWKRILFSKLRQTYLSRASYRILA